MQLLVVDYAFPQTHVTLYGLAKEFCRNLPCVYEVLFFLGSGYFAAAFICHFPLGRYFAVTIHL